MKLRLWMDTSRITFRMGWRGLIWLRTQTNGGIFHRMWETFRFHKMRRVSWPAEYLRQNSTDTPISTSWISDAEFYRISFLDQLNTWRRIIQTLPPWPAEYLTENSSDTALLTSWIPDGEFYRHSPLDQLNTWQRILQTHPSWPAEYLTQNSTDTLLWTSWIPDGEFYRHSPNYAISDVHSFRKVETIEVTAYFERRLKFFLTGMKA